MQIQEYGAWRTRVADALEQYRGWVQAAELLDGAAEQRLARALTRLRDDRLSVAFVAEFSRGKSELINAIFFADTGRRVLPATPGRTTMCPVELAWEVEDAPSLRLLPIETRLEGLSLGELRPQRRAWQAVPLHVGDPVQLAAALTEVTRTRFVSIDEARALGFWDDAHPADNPPLDDDGRAEIPAWRHALINYPHPLLKQGLVVLDTPGLNAIGAEPELTLSLLPTAHATLFILGADTGVTKSDLAVWRDHLGSAAQTRFVVLNKIDALLDPLATLGETEAHILRQCRETARTLGVAADRVFALSARQALAARVARDDASLAASRLPALESALGAQLLPQRQRVLEQAVDEVAERIASQVRRGIGDQRRQIAEQVLEMRGLQGKSAAKVRLLLQRVDIETAEFETCTVRLQALRTVHGRMLKETLAHLTTERLREEVQTMQKAMQASLLNLGAKKAFVALVERLRSLLAEAERRSVEIQSMLSASFAKLNAEFGFSLAIGDPPDLDGFFEELALIDRSYVQYLGLTQALRLSNAKFMEQFRRMLVSKLRVVFEGASSELELWNRGASAQVDSQLRDRRKAFRRRRETLERVQTASGELESRLDELTTQDERLQGFERRVEALIAALHDDQPAASDTAAGPSAAAAATVVDIELVSVPVPLAP